MQPAAISYPATFAFDPPEKVARWRPLLAGILAIPHLLALVALGFFSAVLEFISTFAILFTGKLPEGMAKFQCMYMRYSMRVTTYYLFMREEYPPFTFDSTPVDPGDDPRVRVDAQVELTGRNRLTSFFRWILAIPHYFVLIFLGIAAFFCILIAWFAVLFTGKWPDGLRNFVLGMLRWNVRLQAYTLLLTDQYPPFSLA